MVMKKQHAQIRRWMVGVVAAAALAASRPVGAQGLTPTIPGMVVADAPVEQESAGAEAIVATAIHGVGHALHFTRRLFVHGGTSGSAHDNPQNNSAVTVDSAAGPEQAPLTPMAQKAIR